MNLKLDLTFARVAAEQMDDYLHAEVLFYPVGSINGMQMPQLTIGAWLETAWRLNALRELYADQIADVLNAAQAEVRKVRHRIPDLYQTKARREFKSRLDSWEMFLNDRHDATAQAEPYNAPRSGYAERVHTRFRLELLKDDVAQLSDQLARLRTLDGRLRARFKPGAFLWEPELAAAAPADKFWFLYAKL
ncbi:MAG: hypothetical protein NZM18_02490 [Thermoflexales bacterium]|nr:hypothetical protein [Thermoflexales bacterium]MDW8350519.1 hypothetical protein [Anaerolineae bacterium]